MTTIESAQPVEVLLVEDNPHDAELTVRALKKSKLGNRLHHVLDGAEALDYLFAESRSRPALILLDLKLPKIDGLEVLRRIKSDDALKSTPVVVLTSSKEERDIVQSYRLGVNSYVVKPVDFVKFAEAVTQLGLYWLLVNQPPTAGERR